MPETLGTDPKAAAAFLRRAPQWREEFEQLRPIPLGCRLTEGLKWGWPCYMLGKSNIVLIHGFKDYCALLFFKGSLLKDPKGILNKIGSMQVGRQIRFTHDRELAGMKAVLKSYVQQAIEVEKSGLKVELKKTSDFKVPEEFQKKLDQVPALKAAFGALTPGRQRAYLYYFSGAKQSKTREERVEKCARRILDGKGLNDD